jgi:hypothetical protein
MKNPTTEPTTRREKFKLSIAKKDNGFVVQDENGVVYGPQAANRKQIEEVLNDWKAYYAE